MTLVERDEQLVDAAMVRRTRERLERAHVRLLALTFVDNAGVTRVKVIPLGRLESAVRSGVGISRLWAVSGSDDAFAFVPPYDGPSGDIRLVPDAASARLLRSSPGFAWAPVYQLDEELREEASCQRTVLRRVVEAARARRIEFRTAFETEMTLLNPDGSPAHDGPGYSPRALLPLEPFALELVDALEEAGVEVHQLHPEYSPGQFEVSIAPRDPITAADDVVLLRIVARQVARNHGLEVSFAPVVSPGAAGNGMHFHLSAWQDGENLMAGLDDNGGLHHDGAALTAGILDELPNLLALLAPTVLSYTRLQPHHWSGAYACWGIENREAALRFIPGTINSRPCSTNLEVKVLDSAANPYLAAAALLGASLQGLERAAIPPPPLQDDPASLPEDDRTAFGVRRLPTSLSEATALFAESDFARSLLGEPLHDATIAVQKLEWETAGTLPAESSVLTYRFRF